MPKIVRELPGLVPKINGFAFEPIKGDEKGRSISVDEIPDDAAESFLALPNVFSVFDPNPAPPEAATIAPRGRRGGLNKAIAEAAASDAAAGEQPEQTN